MRHAARLALLWICLTVWQDAFQLPGLTSGGSAVQEVRVTICYDEGKDYSGDAPRVMWSYRLTVERRIFDDASGETIAPWAKRNGVLHWNSTVEPAWKADPASFKE